MLPGTQLGAYEIVGSLGAGGMGEVYRATDTKLGRAVAVKILPDAFAADGDRVPRFEREAGSVPSTPPTRHFDVTPDGKRFLVVLPEGVDGSRRTSINVVLNWAEELDAKLPN